MDRKIFPARFFLLLAGVIMLDQITKSLLRDFSFAWLKVTEVPNSGLAFGVKSGNALGSTVAAFCLGLLSVYYFYSRQWERGQWWGYVLVIGGGFSNLIDRLRLGYVRDNIDLGLMFTFNLADAMIVIGLIVLVIRVDAWKNLAEYKNDTKNN